MPYGVYAKGMESEKLSELLTVPIDDLEPFTPTKWDLRHLEHAEFVGQWSKDRSTKLGSVIVAQDGKHNLSIGYNGFPQGVNDEIEERHERPLKYLYTEHAERNAIFNAADHGTVVHGASLYVPLHPCAECARAIVSVHLKKVFTTNPHFNRAFFLRWEDSINAAVQMFREAGVRVYYLPGKMIPEEVAA